MALPIRSRFSSSSVAAVSVAAVLLVAVNFAQAQKVTVDTAHVANTFSPVRSLGAAIDRLRTGSPDHLLKDPLLHEILGARLVLEARPKIRLRPAEDQA